jgi:hypothetical protein
VLAPPQATSMAAANTTMAAIKTFRQLNSVRVLMGESPLLQAFYKRRIDH